MTALRDIFVRRTMSLPFKMSSFCYISVKIYDQKRLDRPKIIYHNFFIQVISDLESLNRSIELFGLFSVQLGADSVEKS